MKKISDIIKYFQDNSPESCPNNDVYAGFAETVFNEEGDLACLSLASALTRYVNSKVIYIYYSDFIWNQIDLDKLIEYLDKFGLGELRSKEE